MSRRFCAVFTVLFAVLVSGCSGENGSQGPDDAANGGTGSTLCPQSEAIECGNTGGADAAGAGGSSGSSGNGGSPLTTGGTGGGGTGGDTGGAGGDPSDAGSDADADPGTGGVPNGGAGGEAGIGGDPGTGGTGGAGGSPNTGGAGGEDTDAGAGGNTGGTGGDSGGSGGVLNTGGTAGSGGTGGCSSNEECSDNNLCNGTEMCANGTCVDGTDLLCNDGNACTNDSCAPATGCVYANNTNACNDGNACTTNDACSGGACIGGSAPNCNDGNACTSDSCNSATGCVNAPVANGLACGNDGNVCTTDQCVSGACQHTPVSAGSILCQAASCGGVPATQTDDAFCDGTSVCPAPVTTVCTAGACDANSVDCADPMTPFSCNNDWTRQAAFPFGLDLTGDIWGTSMSDIYVATGTYTTGSITHWNGTSWNALALPAVSGTWANMNAVWGSSADDVWAGGAYLPTIGSGRSRLLHSVNGGSFQIDTSFPWSPGEGTVRSIWGTGSDIFVMVDYYINSKRDVKIYRGNTGSWSPMELPPHSSPLHMKQVWGKSSNEVYAVGSQLDTDNNPIDGVLWHFNGVSWLNVTTIPTDVVQLLGVSGSDGVELVGTFKVGGDYYGTHLYSSELSTWTRQDNSGPSAFNSVLSVRPGASITGGNQPTGGVFLPGAARVGVYSLGASTGQAQLDNIAQTISGIWKDPATDTYVLATYTYTGGASVYIGTCQ